MYYNPSKKRLQKPSTHAFTLIELLAVVSVIVILTGIIFGISKGVMNQQARAKAKAELAMIAQALEEFKLTYGDYPVVAEDDPVTTNINSMELTKALTGYAYLEPGASLANCWTVFETRIDITAKVPEGRKKIAES